MEWEKKIAPVFVLKLVTLIKGIQINAFFVSIKHIGTIKEGILDILIKYSIFPQNKFIPVTTQRGGGNTHVVFKISDTLSLRVKKAAFSSGKQFLFSEAFWKILNLI